MSSYPIVMVSKMVPTPSRQAYGGVDLRGLSGEQIEHVRANLPFLMNGIVQFAFGLILIPGYEMFTCVRFPAFKEFKTALAQLKCRAGVSFNNL